MQRGLRTLVPPAGRRTLLPLRAISRGLPCTPRRLGRIVRTDLQLHERPRCGIAVPVRPPRALGKSLPRVPRTSVFFHNRRGTFPEKKSRQADWRFGRRTLCAAAGIADPRGDRRLHVFPKESPCPSLLGAEMTAHKCPRSTFLAHNPFPSPLTLGFFYREKMRAIHRVAPDAPFEEILEVGGGRSGLTHLL